MPGESVRVVSHGPFGVFFKGHRDGPKRLVGLVMVTLVVRI
jgi:hypothetical protein